MNYLEFGQDHPKTILLLHGGGLSWWNYLAEAKLLRSEYHIILPILDGHAGSSRDFTSIEDNAAELLAFIDAHCGREVLLLGGLSLGAQTALEMLSQRSDICRYALIESAAVLPSRLMSTLIGPSVRSSCGLVKNHSFARMQFCSLHMDERFFAPYFRDTSRITAENLAAFLRASTLYALKEPISGTAAQVHVLAGAKETGVILRSAEAICQRIPGSRLKFLSGLYHGEFSLNHPKQYVTYLKQILSDENT